MKIIQSINNWWKQFVKKYIVDKCPPELDDLF